VTAVSHAEVSRSAAGSPGRGLVARLRPLLALLRPQRRLLWVAIACGAANQVLAIATAVLGAYLVGQAATGTDPQQLRRGFFVLVALVAVRAVMPWLESLFSHMMAFRVLVDIRDRVQAAFERLAPGYLLRRRSGDLGATVVGDVELLERFFAHTLSPVVVAAVVPAAAMVTMAGFHWSLPLVLAPVLLAVATVPRWLRARAEDQGRQVRAETAEVHAQVVDGVQGLREIVAFSFGARQLAQLARASARLLGVQVTHGRRVGVERAAVDACVTIGMLIVLVVTAALVATGAMAPALFPPAVILAAFTFAPLTTVVEVATELNLVAASGERVFAVISEPAPVTDRATAPPPGPIPPRVEFDRVGFRYAPELPEVLTDVSFQIAPGETVALVGHSGAGKSTAAHLLLRFWDVAEGTIRLGGHDIRDLPQSTLRDLVAFVPQDVYLFHTNVRDNLRLGRPDASDAEVERAARQALASEFIAALPDGYDTVVGQRQRIAIARALLADAPILVMDEAVSNLDAASEQALAAATAEVAAARTTLVIAHRLSTIRTADRLVVLDGGRVAEVGSHEELLARGGTYARLIASQTAGADGAPSRPAGR
jgi:ABC-type multidrug transport system fused ATPase/permease subunit